MKQVSHGALVALALVVALAGCHQESLPEEAANATNEAGNGVAAASAPGLALRQIPLTIASHGRAHRFTVELAASEAEQEQGLMYRQSLAPDAGMIFPFDQPRVANFWMKNTYIPLDMIFIRKNGSIARIAANAVPTTLDVVSSNEPVTAVLEIAGGRAAELGLSSGDVVHWAQP